ncbi:hypothetical protein HDU76_008169 [Blyttiomyces sp. JEL0837]|nr:hypothetical protein HDU76_008169 [Blyttiomyces sp. JEL0837]
MQWIPCSPPYSPQSTYLFRTLFQFNNPDGVHEALKLPEIEKLPNPALDRLYASLARKYHVHDAALNEHMAYKKLESIERTREEVRKNTSECSENFIKILFSPVFKVQPEYEPPSTSVCVFCKDFHLNDHLVLSVQDDENEPNRDGENGAKAAEYNGIEHRPKEILQESNFSSDKSLKMKRILDDIAKMEE